MTFDPGWETYHRDQARGRWPDTSFVRFAMQRYGDVPDRSAVRFLELGCGAGAQVAFLAEEGFRVAGIDGSRDALNRAADLLARRGVASTSSTFVHADICQLTPTPFATYDCILDICTLQHIPDPNAAAIIAKARGWLKPGGRFFSVMLEESAKYKFPAPVYARDWERVEALFAGYEIKEGRTWEKRPDGVEVAHWIIEAQVAP